MYHTIYFEVTMKEYKKLLEKEKKKEEKIGWNELND